MNDISLESHLAQLEFSAVLLQEDATNPEYLDVLADLAMIISLTREQISNKKVSFNEIIDRMNYVAPRLNQLSEK